MDAIDPELQRLLSELSARGIATSAQLQAALGKSQPTVSRLLAKAASGVLVLGRGRAARYGVARPILGHAAQQPLWWVDEAGVPRHLGTASLLQGDWLHVQVGAFESVARGHLPWFLSPLAPQGFLGRVVAQRLASAGLGSNPEKWALYESLFAALNLHDAPGAIVMGEPSRSAAPAALDADDPGRSLDVLAADVGATLPAGSSAGGEQPKFLATVAAQEAPSQQVLVKFTPPRGTPFGERWHDLLHAEALAARVLARHGVPVATASIVESGVRTYLLSQRFDRVGARGRRHVVAIGAVHTAFVPGGYSNWAASAAALARQGRLPPLAATQAEALLHFGRLIGNSDMHSGNLSLLVHLEDPESLAKGRFALAPVYDMLPMRWRPDPLLGGAADYTPFEPDALAMAGPARAVARLFWAELADCRPASAALREVAAEMVRRLA